MNVEPFTDLVFVYALGCEACHIAMPELDKFAFKNPRMMVMKIQAGGPMVERLLGPVKIRATPTYVLRRGGQGYTREGIMKASEIEKWIGAIVDREEGHE